MAALAHAANLLTRFVNTATYWGIRAAWGANVVARKGGLRHFALTQPAMTFFFRGARDRPVLALFSEDYGFIDTSGGHLVRTIIDSGANIGIFSVRARRLYPQAKIVALEAAPDNFEVLERNLSQVQGTTALYSALWSETGAVSLVRSNDPQAHSITAGEASNADTPAVSIVDLMERFDFDEIDILKMDIEGAEDDVIGSLTPEALSRINAIIFECNDADAPGTAIRVLKCLSAEEFDAFAWGENLYLIRRSTGWQFLRCKPGEGRNPLA